MNLVGGHGVAIDGLDSAFLDCFTDNVAALLRFFGVQDVRTPLACQWHFAFDETEDVPLPAVERVPFDQLVATQTGFELVPLSTTEAPVEACLAMLEVGDPVYVVGNAFHMRWLPYFERRHIDHSFVIDGASEDGSVLHVADAYANRTQWGDAVPKLTELRSKKLMGILEGSSGWRGAHLFVMRQNAEPERVDPDAIVEANATEIHRAVREDHAFARFRSWYSKRTDDVNAVAQFTLACWMVARARSLHALWLADHGRKNVFDDVVSAWRRVAEFAYIMERRVAAGRPAPLAAFELLEATAEPAEERVAESLLRRPAAIG